MRPPIPAVVLRVHRNEILERARTPYFVADHLNARGRKKAALLAVVGPSEKIWRFSLVRME